MKAPPDDDHKAIMALWHMVVGSNGDGIIPRLERLSKRIYARVEKLEKESGDMLIERVTRLEKRGRNIWAVLKDVILIVVAIGSLAIAFVALYIGGTP